MTRRARVPRRIVAAVVGASIASAFAIACGPEVPPHATPLPDQTPPPGASATGPRFDSNATLSETNPVGAQQSGSGGAQGAGDAGSAARAPSQQTFPPPKPVVIKLARGDGSPPDAELAQGDAAMEASDYRGAEAHYAKAAKLAPKDAAAKVGKARASSTQAAPDFGYASAKGDRTVTAAVAALKSVVADPANASYGPGFAELGRAELLLGDAPSAVDHLKRAVELLPQEAEVHSALGVAELATGDAKAALSALKRAVELDPGSAPRHGNLGTVYFMLGQVSDAIPEYEIEVRLADTEPRAHSDLGTALLASNDLTRGVTELRRAVALDPHRATFHSNLGYALQLGNKKDEAIAEYREALRLDPKLVSALVNLATVLARDPKTRAEARNSLEQAKKIAPDDPRVKANMEELDALEKGQILH
jgi:Flp pilus assembly protein TadD